MPGCEVERGGAAAALVRTLVRQEQVKLWAGGHGVPAQRVLPRQEVGNNGGETDFMPPSLLLAGGSTRNKLQAKYRNAELSIGN